MSIKSKTIHKLRHIAINDSGMGRRTDRILSSAEVTARLHLEPNSRVSYMVDRNSRTLFFTSGHGYGHSHMPKNFVAITETGNDTADKLLSVDTIVGSYNGFTVANNIKELAEIMDKRYPDFGHVKDTEEPNWQPEHFPEGTVVELKNYFYDTETGDIVHTDRDGTLKHMWVTVTSVVKNGIDSYCIVTDRASHGWKGGFDTYNFSHVGRILARGNGPLVWYKYEHESYFEKNNIRKEPLKSDHYYWSDIRVLMPHILSSIPGAKNKLLKDTFIRQINEQSFVKKLVLFEFYTLKHAPKKKLREFVRKNWNRWLMSGKEIRQAERDHQLEMERMYEEDLDREIDATRGSSDTLSPGMPGMEQTQADVSLIANSGESDISSV